MQLRQGEPMQRDVPWMELPVAELRRALAARAMALPAVRLRAARTRPKLRRERQGRPTGELAPPREQLVLQQQEQAASQQPERLQALWDPQAPRPKARRASGERLWRLPLWRLSPLGRSPRRRLLPRLAVENEPGLFLPQPDRWSSSAFSSQRPPLRANSRESPWPLLPGRARAH